MYRPLVLSQESGFEDAKSTVVEVLSREWPLTAKQVYAHAVNSNGGRSFSYQAIHKTLQELLAKGIVCGEAGAYSLSRSCIDSQKELWSSAQKRYSGNAAPSLTSIQPNSSVLHVFTGVITVPYWLIAETPAVVGSSDAMVQQWFFAWPAQMVSEEQHKLVKKYADFGGNYLICRGNSAGDLHCLKYLEEVIGAKWIAGADIASECDLIVFKDFIISVYWPDEFKKKITSAFSSPSLASAMKEVYDYVFYGDGASMQVPVTITRNETLAKQIISGSLALFEKRKEEVLA